MSAAMKIPGRTIRSPLRRAASGCASSSTAETVADTRRALVLQEASYKPVFYIPREDAQLALLEKTTHGTHCPYKGDASYYSIKVGDRIAENAIWSYEAPFPAMREIAGHLAFYPNRVDAIEVTAG